MFDDHTEERGEGVDSYYSAVKIDHGCFLGVARLGALHLGFCMGCVLIVFAWLNAGSLFEVL